MRHEKWNESSWCVYDKLSVAEKKTSEMRSTSGAQMAPAKNLLRGKESEKGADAHSQRDKKLDLLGARQRILIIKRKRQA